MPSAIVIGAGPAGSLSALLLARHGFDVQLLEQHRFPRDKVCGECLSAVGIDVLTRARLDGVVRQLAPTVLTRTLIHPADGPALELPLPRPMWGVTRSDLDRTLLAAAASAGVVVRQPARCESVTGGRPPQIVWRDLESNRSVKAVADWVIVADGKGSLLPPGQPLTGDLGIKAHFTDVDGPQDAIELFAGPGCYGGLAAVNGELWNAAFSVPAASVRAFRGDIAAVFREVCRFNPTLVGRMRSATRVSPWLAAPLPRSAVRHRWPTGVVPIGNAAAALEPIGGEGMGLALRSAELAADVINSHTHGRRATAGDLPCRYKSLWRLRRLACRGAAVAASNPHCADVLAPLLIHNPRLATTLMRWAGKQNDEVATDQ